MRFETEMGDTIKQWNLTHPLMDWNFRGQMQDRSKEGRDGSVGLFRWSVQLYNACLQGRLWFSSRATDSKGCYSVLIAISNTYFRASFHLTLKAQ
jgi:hypothetical protein